MNLIRFVDVILNLLVQSLYSFEYIEFKMSQ